MTDLSGRKRGVKHDVCALPLLLMACHDKTKRIPKGSVIKRTPQGSTQPHSPVSGAGGGFAWRIPKGSAHSQPHHFQV
jgi:hypothetical protein